MFKLKNVVRAMGGLGQSESSYAGIDTSRQTHRWKPPSLFRADMPKRSN